MRSQLRPTIVCFVLLTLITGVVYPAAVTAIAQIGFRHQSEGSLIFRNGQAVGSELIGQPFSDPKYFWSRPSATSPVPYAAQAGSGSNLGPSNPALADAIKQRTAALKAADPDNLLPIPVDLLTASGSGLDPHISPAAAAYQVGRIARVRQIPIDAVEQLVEQATERPAMGNLGEARVNVLKLNLALDAR